MVITCMRTVGCKTTLFMRWTVRGPTPSDGSHRGPPRRRCSRAKLVHRSLAQWKPLRIEVATQLSARAQLSPPRARPYRADARAAGPAGPLHEQLGNGSTAPGNNARALFSGPRFLGRGLFFVAVQLLPGSCAGRRKQQGGRRKIDPHEHHHQGTCGAVGRYNRRLRQVHR